MWREGEVDMVNSILIPVTYRKSPNKFQEG